MFREEALKMKEVHEGRVRESQDQIDEFVRHAMPYLRGLVQWYDKNQEAGFALENLKCRLDRCEEEEDE